MGPARRPLAEPVLVTGGMGFIGGHLVRTLVAGGCRPVLMSRGPGRPPGLPGLEGRVRWAYADVRDREAVEAVFSEVRPATVFHMAGVRGGGGTACCVETSVCGTWHVVGGAARVRAERTVILGSAEEYGSQPGPLREALPLLPTSAYGISKLAATQLALTMHRQEGAPVVILRPFTVYGPGQPRGMFLADAVAAALEDVPFAMTEGLQRRDFVFVQDVVEAILAAATAPGIEGRTINVGSGRAHRLRDVAALVWRLCSSTGSPLVGGRRAGQGELHDTWADLTLARELLGWEPRVDLEVGLCAMIGRSRGQRCPVA